VLPATWTSPQPDRPVLNLFTPWGWKAEFTLNNTTAKVKWTCCIGKAVVVLPYLFAVCLFLELKKQFEEMLASNNAHVKKAINSLNAVISQQLVTPPDTEWLCGVTVLCLRRCKHAKNSFCESYQRSWNTCITTLQKLAHNQEAHVSHTPVYLYSISGIFGGVSSCFVHAIRCMEPFLTSNW